MVSNNNNKMRGLKCNKPQMTYFLDYLVYPLKYF